VSNLRVIIDRLEKTARFSGSGTYHAKEEIKRLGPARFNGSDKSWEVRSFELSTQELEEIFPGIIVEESSSLTVVTVERERAPEAPAPSAGEQAGIPSGVSVSEFLARTRAVLRSAFPKTLFLYGVLAQVKARGDRVFMELKESSDVDDRVKCVIWQDYERKTAGLAAAGFQLEPDLQVMFEVSVQLNRSGGEISLSVERIVAEYTIGRLAALREVTNERLRKEDLFGKNKQLRLPFVPRRFGILTSAGGTVIHDFMSSLDQARFGFELLWKSVSVQGSEAKKSLLDGIAFFSRLPDLDGLLLFRGGGSPAELAVFNDYDIARAICVCPVPVLSAIGHEADQSSAQDVSFRAFGVPKDLGHFLAQIILDFRTRFATAKSFVRAVAGATIENVEHRLSATAQSLAQAFSRTAEMKLDECNRLQQQLPALGETLLTQRQTRFRDVVAPLTAFGLRSRELSSARLQSCCQQLAHRSEAAIERAGFRLQRVYPLPREISRLVEQKEHRVQALTEILDGAAPETQLRRGFVIVRSDRSERILLSRADAEAGEIVELQFHDGRRKAALE
jgi:exodeoxyribonuclease VII large subunit